MTTDHHPIRTIEGTVPWPPELADDYRRRGLWQDRPLGAWILDAADRDPEKIALISGDVRMTYRELVLRMDAGARRLLDLGLKPDNRLLVQLPNDWQFVVLTLACFRAGVIPVMALPAHRSHELTHLASISQAVAIAVPDEIKGFDHNELARSVADSSPFLRWMLVSGEPGPGAISLDALLDPSDDPTLREHFDGSAPDPDSPACFLLSGGTTGLPKLITRTHNDYACNILETSRVSQLDVDSVYLGTLPASHNFPLACPGILGALFMGATAVMLPSAEPTRAFAAMDAEGVTHAAAVPAVVQRWLEHQRDTGGSPLRTLRVLQVGGSRLPDELAARITPALGATVQQVFGMAEGLINMTRLDDPLEAIISTQGRPVCIADEVRVVDEHGRDVPDGSVGTLLTRGPYTPHGYYRAPEHNARSFVDGWYGSGDVIVRRADGNLVVMGRDKDIINRGGEKISAEEVENIAYRLEAVDLAAAVSVPDSVLGERLCMCVSLMPGAELDLDQLREFMRQQGIAAFKLPERLEVMDSLPMTKVGKIDKRALRESLLDPQHDRA